MLFVMFFLAGDIFHHRRDIRFADAENSVACLPFKIWAPFFANPTRGICFYDAGKFGRSLCLASLEQCHLDRRTVQIEIQFRSEGGFASAEDQMEKDVSARMRHCLSPLQG